MNEDEELEEFLTILYRATIRCKFYLTEKQDDAYIDIIQTICAGECDYAVQNLITEIKNCNLPIYPWDLEDLENIWVHIGKDLNDFPDIPECPEGESPWGPEQPIHQSDSENIKEKQS